MPGWSVPGQASLNRLEKSSTRRRYLFPRWSRGRRTATSWRSLTPQASRYCYSSRTLIPLSAASVTRKSSTPEAEGDIMKEWRTPAPSTSCRDAALKEEDLKGFGPGDQLQQVLHDHQTVSILTDGVGSRQNKDVYF